MDNQARLSISQKLKPWGRDLRENGGEPLPKRFRHSAIQLLAALGVLVLSAPFVEDLPAGDLIEALLITTVMVCSVAVVGGGRGMVVIALVLLFPALVGKWVNHFSRGPVSSCIYLIGGTVFFLFVVTHLIRFILRARTVDANVLCAGLSGYLLLGLLWVPAYVLAGRLDPGAFNMSAAGGAPQTMDGFNAFYFSFITLSTVGYGDVIPLSKGARMLAVTEAVAGLFYIAVLISRLVAIYSSRQASPQATGATAREERADEAPMHKG